MCSRNRKETYESKQEEIDGDAGSVGKEFRQPTRLQAINRSLCGFPTGFPDENLLVWLQRRRQKLIERRLNGSIHKLEQRPYQFSGNFEKHKFEKRPEVAFTSPRQEVVSCYHPLLSDIQHIQTCESSALSSQ